MTAVAKGLVGALAASAPEIGFAGFDLDGKRRFLGNHWIGHVLWFPCWAVRANAERCSRFTVPLSDRSHASGGQADVQGGNIQGGNIKAAKTTASVPNGVPEH